MDRGAKIAIFITIVGTLIAGASLMRDLFDYKIELGNQVDFNKTKSKGSIRVKIDPLKVDSSKGEVILRRDNSFAGGVINYKIYINEIYFDKIKINQKKSILLIPGEYKIIVRSYNGNESNEIQIKLDRMDSKTINISTPLINGGFIKLELDN